MAILIVDTDPAAQILAAECFRWADHRLRIDCVDNLQAACEVSMTSRPTVVVADPALPELPGPQICAFLAPYLPPGAIFAAYTDDLRLAASFNAGPFSGVLLKPPSRLDALHFLNLSRRTIADFRRDHSFRHKGSVISRHAPVLQSIKVNVCLANDEHELKFKVSIFRGARVENIIRQLGKEVTGFVVMRENREVQPSNKSTVLDDNDTLMLIPRSGVAV